MFLEPLSQRVRWLWWGRGGPTKTGALWGPCAPPGICARVDCWGSPRPGPQGRCSSPFTFSWVFTCVSGSGVLAGPRPVSLLCHWEEVLALAPARPHAPHSCPRPGPGASSGHGGRVPPSSAPFSSRTSPWSLYNFFIREVVSPTPAPNLGSVTYLSGFVKAPLCLSSGGLWVSFKNSYFI